jgi:hypothetical protein
MALALWAILIASTSFDRLSPCEDVQAVMPENKAVKKKKNYQQYDIGDLSRYVSSRAHRHRDVAGSKCNCVVDPIPYHSDNSPLKQLITRNRKVGVRRDKYLATQSFDKFVLILGELIRQHSCDTDLQF